MHDRSGSQSTAALRNKVGDIGHDLRDVANIAADAGLEQLNKVRDAAVSRINGAKDRVGSWEASLESYVRERPLKSLCLAVAAGMLTAFFLRRRA
jgi:ElaB/YqjD/DUF883 family membrane-anchored ribosome-binding protein